MILYLEIPNRSYKNKYLVTETGASLVQASRSGCGMMTDESTQHMFRREICEFLLYVDNFLIQIICSSISMNVD